MRRAFTLIELLVVISIIALLIAILLPALGKARFTVQITQCASNKQQLGVILHSYAVDNDGQFPTPGISGSAGNPWDTSVEFADSMIEYGLTDPMLFFCPADTERLEHATTFGPPIGADKPLSDLDDMKLYLTRGTFSWHILPFIYWVPREYPAGIYPSIDHTSTHPDGWATGVDDPRGLLRPIVTDLIVTPTATGSLDPNLAVGGHRASQEDLQSTTHLYVDGHVEVVPETKIEARSGPGITASGNLHAFY